MTDEAKHPIKREKGGLVVCTVSFTADQVTTSEEKAARELGKEIKIDGFRPGNAPLDQLKEKLNSEELMNETIRGLLPEVMEEIVKEHEIAPIIPPRVDIEKTDPMTIKIIFFEKPEVKLKGADKIKVKMEEPKIEDKDVDGLVEYVRKQHQTSADKAGTVEKDDRVTMDFWGETLDGKEVEGIRTTGHQVIVGSNVLLPGFEDELIGMKAGDKKDFNLTFPEKHQVEELQNKPVSFHVTVTKVETVTVPELTDDFVKKNLQAESVDAFKKQVRESMVEQEKQSLRRKYEEEALDKIRQATQVDLAPELIDDEFRALLEDLQQHLAQQQMDFPAWLEQNGKKPEEAEKELREQAEKRLTLRLGLAQLVDEKDVEVSDDEMSQTIEAFLAQVSEEERKEIAPAYEKGQQAYEQLKWQKKVEKILDDIIQ